MSESQFFLCYQREDYFWSLLNSKIIPAQVILCVCISLVIPSKNPWIKVGNVFEFETNSSMLSKEQNRKAGSVGPLCYNFPLWRATPQRGFSQKVKGLSISVVHLVLCGSWDYDSFLNCQVSSCFVGLCKQENSKREDRRGPWLIRLCSSPERVSSSVNPHINSWNTIIFVLFLRSGTRVFTLI